MIYGPFWPRSGEEWSSYYVEWAHRVACSCKFAVVAFTLHLA